MQDIVNKRSIILLIRIIWDVVSSQIARDRFLHHYLPAASFEVMNGAHGYECVLRGYAVVTPNIYTNSYAYT